MAWTAPKSWAVGELLTAEDLNVHIRDNLLALKGPPTALVRLDQAVDYTTTSSSFVAIDNVNLNHTLTTTGGDVLIVFFANILNTTSFTYVDIEFDGVMIGGEGGLARAHTNVQSFISLCVLKTSVGAGSHIIRILWKAAAGTSTLYAGGGAAGTELHPLFWVREV